MLLRGPIFDRKVAEAFKATENISVSLESKWPGLEKCEVAKVCPWHSLGFASARPRIRRKYRIVRTLKTTKAV